MIDSAALVHGIHLASTLSAAGTCFFVRAIAAPAFAHSRTDAKSRAAFERLAIATIAGMTLVALVTGILWLFTTSASMSGRSVRDALNPAIFGVVITRTLFGKVWVSHIAVCLALMAITMLAHRSARSGRPFRWWGMATVCGALLAATLVGAGHAAADDGPFHAHPIADTLHLLAAAIWLGSLPLLAYLLAHASRHPGRGQVDTARVATDRFSPVGMTCVATLVATGTVNSWFLVGTVPALIGTAYGRMLSLKLALFAAMIGLAAINRWLLAPKIAVDRASDSTAAARQLCRNACLEYGLGLGVLMVVGALNVSVPAAHDVVIWPFSFTLRWTEFLETEHAAAILCLSLLLAAAGLAVAGWAPREGSQRRIVLGLGMIGAAAAFAGTSMTGPAFPTTYAASARPFAATSIAHGAQLYRDNCATCHGVDGYGDGPLATTLPIKPPDLAAGHLLHHLDGDLFWWISHGIANTPMPAFASVLSPNACWDVIEFLHAQIEAETAKRLTTSVEPWQPFVAPNFDYEIGHDEQRSLLALRGRSAVLLVLYTWPGSRPRLEVLHAARPRMEAAGAQIVAFPITGSSQADAIFAHADPNVVATYGLYRRTPTGHATPPMPAHMEFLIDRQGYLRARWLSINGPGLSDVEPLLGELDQLRREAPHPPAPLVAGHIH